MLAGEDRVRLTDGSEVIVPKAALAGRSGPVAIGIRPEKIRVGEDHPNRLTGRITETAYIGVSTQYLVDTPAGSVAVYVQNDRPGGAGMQAGDTVSLSWDPECTFVIERTETS